jgi:hypothetical protein
VHSTPFGKDATWHYTFYDYGFTGYISLTYTSDTLINGLLWQQFQRGGIRHIQTGPDPYNDVMQWPIGGYFYLHSRNDSVFRMLPDSSAQLLYDFNAKVGDSWQFDVLDTTWGCKDMPIATVTNIGYDTIQGYPLKFWEVIMPQDSMITVFGDTVYSCSASSCLPTKVYKDFGSSSFIELFEPDPNACMLLKTATTQNWYQMRCFSSPTMNLNFTNQACDYWSLIGIDEQEVNKLKIYPNPSNGFVFIDTEKEISTVDVYDVTGRKIVAFANSQNIELPQQSGLYFLHITLANGGVLVEKVVRE